MFKIHAVQARFGDSFILEYGTQAKRRFILIDGGPPDTYENDLKAAIDKIVTTRDLDLVVLSHIDADHVVGLLDFFASIESEVVSGAAPSVRVAGLWHNSFQKTIDTDGGITQRMQVLMSTAGAASVAMPQLAGGAFFGVRDGNRLRIFAKKLKIPLNKGFNDDLVIVETAPATMKFDNLTFRVVGPTQANLNALRAAWIKWLKKTETQMMADPKSLANSDQSVPNLSSIVLLAECDGKTVLLTGDARSDHTYQGLEAAGLLSNGKLHVDVLKVAHHGSDRNVTKTFFKNVTADLYLISADGTYSNPDYATLTWIVDAAKSDGRAIEIVVTNETDSTKKLLTTHDPAAFGYKLTVKSPTANSIAISLA
jgi:hypothetical protein